MKIIYPNADFTISVIFPSGLLPIEQVALKDVPYNAPYLFIQDSDIPTDSPQESWVADFSTPDGYGLGAQRWFIQQAEQKIAELKALTFPDVSVPEQLEGMSDEDYISVTALVYEKHQHELAEFEQKREAAVQSQLSIIAQMKAEVLEVEGIQL